MLFGIHGAHQKTELAAIISLVRSEPLSDSSSIVCNGQNVSTFCHRVCTEHLTCLRLQKDLASGPTRRDIMTLKRRAHAPSIVVEDVKVKWHAYSCDVWGHC